MKKIMTNIKNKVTELYGRAKAAIDNVKAEGYVDSGVKILIAVVIGALLLSGLYTLFNDKQYDKLLKEIESFFLPMAEKTGTLWEHMSDYASCCHGFASHVAFWLNKITE